MPVSESSVPERRTRSQVALPDDILQIPQRSPMKDAKTAFKAQANASDDELLLSPMASASKRSASPDHPHKPGSPSNGRELKRVKRDLLLEGRRLASGHTRNNSEPSLPTAKRSSRKRSSKKPLSTVSASPPPSVFSPVVSPNKGRAWSVPLLPVTSEFPRIDFRNLPPTPTRSRSSSRSPVKEKLRIVSTLPTIHDEQNSPLDIQEEKKLSHAFETSTEPPKPSQGSVSAVIPATPITDSLNRWMPMSPLTPVPETPFPNRIASNSDTESRYDMATGWGVNLFKNGESSKPTNAPSTSNNYSSRLPKPKPLLTKIPSQSSATAASTTSKKHAVDSSNITAKQVQVATAGKMSAFDFLMKKPLQAKAKLEERAKAIVAQKTSTKGAPSIKQQSTSFAVPQALQKIAPLDRPRMRLKEKMKPREKKKVQKGPLLIPMADEEEEDLTPAADESNADISSSAAMLRPSPAILVESSPTRADSEKVVTSHDTLMNTEESRVAHIPSDAAAIGPTPDTVDAERSAHLPIDEPSNDENNLEFPSEKPPFPTKPGPSKLPLGKKRQPSSVTPAARVTRSVSRRKDNGAATSELESNKPAGPSKLSSLKRTASGRVKSSACPVEEIPRMETDPVPDFNLAPGSPMKTSSPTRSPPQSPAGGADDGQITGFGSGKLTLSKTPRKSNGFIKPASTPSPSKIARATSMFIKPTITSMSGTLPMDLSKSAASGSSLSTLSNALEKLRMPPPSRPNTSMGFNRDVPEDDDDIPKPSSKDDGDMRIGHPAVGLKRAATLGAAFIRGPASSDVRGNGKNLVQKPLSSFMFSKGTSGNGFGLRGPTRTNGGKVLLSGVGGPVRKTISKKTSLPMVVGSPVKGGGNDTIMQELEDDLNDNASVTVENDSAIYLAPENASTGSLSFDDLGGDKSPKEKEKEKSTSRTLNASRRVSMVSHALCQSLSSLPQSNSRSVMGPPPTPPSIRTGTRSSSSHYPSSSTSGQSPQSDLSTAGTRSSARIATKASQTKAATEAQNSSGKKGEDAAPATVPEALQILNDCVIFVDVKTDDGDEAGSLFVEMLEGIGAKVLTRVGQTCTHIVYKNGLMSTLTRYKLLRDPKPKVVGIGWVVVCVEQRKHVDETDFLVDLEDVNVAGMNKRRRSILPKLLADAPDSSADANETDENEGDRSLDASSSQGELAPLERARRRKSLLVGPRP